jgi:hypothetical protein
MKKLASHCQLHPLLTKISNDIAQYLLIVSDKNIRNGLF